MKVALLHFCFEDYTVELANSLAKHVDLTLIQPEKVFRSCCVFQIGFVPVKNRANLFPGKREVANDCVSLQIKMQFAPAALLAPRCLCF